MALIETTEMVQQIQIYRKYGKPVSTPSKTNSVRVGPAEWGLVRCH